MDKEQAMATFDDMDNIDIRPRKGADKDPKTVSRDAKEENKIDVIALISDKVEEERSEVMSVRLTPSARKKIEKIWLSQRQKRKKLKESTVAAEILMKVLEQY